MAGRPDTIKMKGVHNNEGHKNLVGDHAPQAGNSPGQLDFLGAALKELRDLARRTQPGSECALVGWAALHILPCE